MYGKRFNEPWQLESVVAYACSILAGVKFDTLVFRGFSGTLVGPATALRLGKRWALIRKQGDTAHSSRIVEGDNIGDYVIIDDFLDTGHTVRTIAETLSKLTEIRSACVGVVFYEQNWCNGAEDARDYWQNKVGTIPILNWRHLPALTPEPKTEPFSDSFYDWMKKQEVVPKTTIVRSSYGGVKFREPKKIQDSVFMDIETDYSNLLSGPPLPEFLKEVAF